MANIPYGDVGQAAYDVSDDLTVQELYTGTHSSFFSDFPYAESTELSAFSVVGVNADGDLALATEDKTVQAIGVLMAPVLSAAGETGSAPIARDGCFNPAALVWDSSYDDDAKIAAAFEGAPSPTQITTQKIVG